MCGASDDSAVSPLLKYVIFFFNLVFWLLSAAIIAVGGWAFYEKTQFDNKETKTIYDVVFDISVVMMVVGSLIFILAFAGCLGALRENIFLLRFFAVVLGILFLVEVVGAILAFLFSSWLKLRITAILKEELIVRYRDDRDLENLVNWIQGTFQCCGVGYKSYQDWSRNSYFNCTKDPKDNPSMERCAVPYSCCVKQNEFEENLINTQCGYQVQTLSPTAARKKVFTIGCVQAMLDKAEDNLIIVGAVAVALAVQQLLAIFLSWMLSRQVEDQKARWI